MAGQWRTKQPTLPFETLRDRGSHEEPIVVEDFVHEEEGEISEDGNNDNDDDDDNYSDEDNDGNGDNDNGNGDNDDYDEGRKVVVVEEEEEEDGDGAEGGDCPVDA